MKSDKLQLLRDLPMTPDHWDVPVRLYVNSYAEFCRRMDRALRQLVAQWAHQAAPNAGNRRR